MKYTRLGKTGLEISRLALGCMTYGEPDRGSHPWSMGEEESRVRIREALDAGINFFDTANVYSDGSSEEIVGRALRDFANRDEIVLATKVYNRTRPGQNGAGLSRKAILQELDNSLKRLGTDYVDLYQIHRFDYETPVEETLEALNDVVKAGKVRYIGASSMHAWQFCKMLYVSRQNGWAQFVSMQNYVNLIYREEEREMLPLCKEEGIGVIPWSPLARGRLTRPWEEQTARSASDDVAKRLFHEQTADVDQKIVEAVASIASSRGVPMAQVALAWVLSKSEISAPIVGATKPAHLSDAIAALDLELTPEEIASLEAPYQPKPVSGYK